MKEILFKAIPFEKKLVTLALESGVDGVIVEPERVEQVKELGRVQVFTPADFDQISLAGKGDEELAAESLRRGSRVILSDGWEIIPVENLLAQGQGLGVEAGSYKQAVLASGILERGVDFVVVLPSAAAELKAIVRELKVRQHDVPLAAARITAVEPVGLGHRVCVDTISMLPPASGMLVGNSSAFTFLVHAETEDNPYVAARPFRVNAGAVHAYCLMPGDKTSYLEELRAGSEVLIVQADGGASKATVGRVKVEIRPMLLVRAEAGGEEGAVFLQNAETIRLVRPDGSSVSVVHLRPGDEVLVRTDAAGRHFGMRIKEEIKEV